MKKVITAAKRAKTYDKQGLTVAVRNAMQAAHKQSKFKDCKLNLHSMEVQKETRPVRFDVKVKFTLEGPVSARYTYDGFTGTLFIFDIPTNTEIPDNYYTQNESFIQKIIHKMESYYTLEEEYNKKVPVFYEIARRYQEEVTKLEDKYDVELKVSVYPKEPEGGNDNEITLYCYLVSADRDDFHFALFSGFNSYGLLTDRRTGSSIELYVGSGGAAIDYVKEDSDSAVTDAVRRTENFITKTLNEFDDNILKLRELPNNESVVESFLQQFTQKYASQYPGLNIDYRSYRSLNGARLSVTCDPDIEVKKDIDYPCSSADYTKWTRSIAGMLKKRYQNTPERYSSDSELITL